MKRNQSAVTGLFGKSSRVNPVATNAASSNSYDVTNRFIEVFDNVAKSGMSGSQHRTRRVLASWRCQADRHVNRRYHATRRGRRGYDFLDLPSQTLPHYPLRDNVAKSGMDALKGRRLIGQKELTCVFGLLCGERSSEQRINRSTDHVSPTIMYCVKGVSGKTLFWM